jgi:hypothetical protein
MWEKGFTSDLKYSWMCIIIASLFFLVIYALMGFFFYVQGAEALLVGVTVCITMVLFQLLFKKKIKRILNPFMSFGLCVYGIAVLYTAD